MKNKETATILLSWDEVIAAIRAMYKDRLPSWQSEGFYPKVNASEEWGFKFTIERLPENERP